MAVIKGRKAVFFTLAVFLLITVLVLAMRSSTHYAMINRTPVVEDRIYSANSLVAYTEEVYLPRALAFAGRHAMEAYIKNMTAEDIFYSEDDFNKYFSNLVITGTMDGTGEILNEQNLGLMIENITKLANDELGIKVNIVADDVIVYQPDDGGAWYLTVNVTVDTAVDANVADWETRKNISARVSILGLDDPYYYLNANMFERTIVQTNYTLWNYSNFENHLRRGTYAYNKDAPSFLTRILNDTIASSCCGIESFINKSESFKVVGGQLDGYQNVSFVDYCYFSEGGAENRCRQVFEVIPLTTDDDEWTPDDFTYPFRVDPFGLHNYNLTEDGGSTKIYPDDPNGY